MAFPIDALRMRKPLLTSSFDPATLFTGSLVGMWYDPSDLSTLFQDSAGTTPVTADGQPVGKMLDKSGNNFHMTQATSSKRPTFKDSGGLRWLDFDGVDDYMDATTASMAQPNDFSLALRPKSSATNMNFFDGITSREALYRNNTTTAFNMYAGTLSTGSATGINDGTDYVATARFNSTSSKVRRNRVDGSSVSPGSGALNGLRLGAFSTSGGGQADFRLYGFIGRDTVFTNTELDNLEPYLGYKAGLSL